MNPQQTDRASSVAITGLGAITPYGEKAAMFFEAILTGEHTFGPIRLFNAQGHRTQVAAEIHTLPTLEPKRVDKATLSRCDLLAFKAAFEALNHAGWLDESEGRVLSQNRIGVIVGTAAGGILGVERFFRARASGMPITSPLSMLSSFCLSSLATNIAKEFAIEGPRMTIATVCSSSGLALAAAKELLQTEDLDAVLVAGAETLSEVSHAGFNSLRAIASERCQPFDLNRKGLILGEGAGAMVLERIDSAKKREVPILAYLRGYALTTDTHHFTAPQPEGQAIAATVVQALADSELKPEEIPYVNAHGTGTKLNDTAETRGLRTALGPQADKTVVSSTKSMIGHQMGAASILEGLATVRSLQQGTIHPTANLETPDPDCDLDYASDGARKGKIHCALSNSFAFGGSNISLAFSRDPGKKHVALTPQPGHGRTPVITGIGVVSPMGIGKEDFSTAVTKRKIAIKSLESVGDEWASLRGAMVDMAQVNENTPQAIRRRLNRQASFLFVSFKEAMVDAGISLEKGTEMSMAYGSAFGCSGNVHRFYSQLLKDGPRFVSPMEFNMSVTNAPPSLIAQQFGLKGPIWVFVADEASWDISLQWAGRQIRAGRADQVAVCAAEEINESILAITHKLGLLETREKKGVLLGEGAVCMVLESENSALRRGARLYGTMAGGYTVQDSSCGPLAYSRDPRHLIQAATQSLHETDKQGGDLLCVSPDNGSPGLEKVAAVTLDKMKNLWNKNTSMINFKTFFGESGVSGGLGLAAALLDQDHSSYSHILVLTGSRGGINAATMIRQKV